MIAIRGNNRLWSLVPLLLSGCGAGDRVAEDEVVMRDSAGVWIVENLAELGGGGLGREMGPDPHSAPPLLELGAEDGEGPEVFGRVEQVLRLRSGEVAVADGLAREVRVFSAAGAHLRTIGRRGEGPGEFVSLTRVAEVPGDSLDVVDNLGGRVSVFAPSGDFTRSFPLPRIPRGLAPNVVGWLGDGTLAMSTFVPEPVAGVRNVVVYLVDREGRVAGEVGEYPHVPLGRNGMGVVFAGAAEFAVGESLIWYGQSSRFELRAFGRDGAVRRIVRLARAPSSVTRADIEANLSAVREDLERQGANPNLLRRILESEFAATYPLHGPLLAARSGELWVERFRNHIIPDEGPRQWDVFDPEGRLRGSITLPAGFQVTEAGADYLVGVHADSVGVQRVRLYRIACGQSSGSGAACGRGTRSRAGRSLRGMERGSARSNSPPS